MMVFFSLILAHITDSLLPLINKINAVENNLFLLPFTAERFLSDRLMQWRSQDVNEAWCADVCFRRHFNLPQSI